MKTANIRLEQATVRFGTHTALDSFTGEFTPGTVTALIGGDGAGKTTLLKLLAGRLKMHEGHSDNLPFNRNNVGYQPADSGVWRNLSVAENIEFIAHTYGLDSMQTRVRSEELLQKAGLDHVTDRLAGWFSPRYTVPDWYCLTNRLREWTPSAGLNCGISWQPRRPMGQPSSSPPHTLTRQNVPHGCSCSTTGTCWDLVRPTR